MSHPWSEASVYESLLIRKSQNVTGERQLRDLFSFLILEMKTQEPKAEMVKRYL